MQSRSKLHRKGGMIMSAPLKDNKCIVAIFDSYAKTVMRNECRNAADEENEKERMWERKRCSICLKCRFRRIFIRLSI